MTLSKNTRDRDERHLRRCRLIASVTPLMGTMLTPSMAFAADDNAPTFSAMLSSVTDLVNHVFLPIAIVAAGWKIIYLVIFPGLLGIDPFNQVPDGYSLQWDAVWTLVKYHFTGFFKGLLWVGGICVMFNFVVSIVSVMAANLDDVM
jgi:hypothetical protein